ncbi:MAG: YhjD/YihY/BrkB family envelope integrity protein [Bacteroidota bacterium]
MRDRHPAEKTLPDLSGVEPFAPSVVSALWRADTTAPPRWKADGIEWARVVYAVVRDVVEGRLALHAASLVYTTILSLVPILALAFSILKGFGVHYRFEPLLMQALKPLGSQSQEIAERLMSFVDKMNVGVLGAVGLALLFYTAVSVVQKIEAACNEIWHVRRERPLARKITDYLSILLIGPVLIFSALGIAASVLASEPVRQLSEIRPLGAVIDTAIRVAPIVLVIGAFTFLYKFIPNTRVPFISALVGGSVATVIWVLAGIAFAQFAQGATSYTAIYSALASLVLFFIWLDVSWLIVLVGAAVSFYHAHPEYILLGSREPTLSGRHREQLALAVGHTIGRAMYAGEEPLTTGALARRLSIPEYAVSETLRALTAAKLVSRTEAQPTRWLPTRPLDRVRVKALLDAAREHGNGVNITALPGPAGELEQAVDRALDEAVGGWTLRDLALGSDAPDSPRTAIAAPRPAHPADRA